MAMEFITIKFGTDNAAFANPGPEIARILRKIANHFETTGTAPNAIRDINGNFVGEVQILEGDDD